MESNDGAPGLVRLLGQDEDDVNLEVVTFCPPAQHGEFDGD